MNQTEKPSSNKTTKYLETNIKTKGNFLSFLEKKYEITSENGEKKITSWECVDYNNRIDNDLKNSNAPNAVSIIPIIKKTREVIIISCFRYPINKFCLEFPSGIIDQKDGEDPLISTKNAAERELLEETGYKGKFKCYLGNNKLSVEKQFNICSNVFWDPWKSKDCSIQCILEVDDNCQPIQKLDPDEIIKVYKVKLDNLMDFINEKIENENCTVTCELYSFACGLYFSKNYNNELFN